MFKKHYSKIFYQAKSMSRRILSYLLNGGQVCGTSLKQSNVIYLLQRIDLRHLHLLLSSCPLDNRCMRFYVPLTHHHDKAKYLNAIMNIIRKFV